MYIKVYSGNSIPYQTDYYILSNWLGIALCTLPFAYIQSMFVEIPIGHLWKALAEDPFSKKFLKGEKEINKVN